MMDREWIREIERRLAVDTGILLGTTAGPELTAVCTLASIMEAKAKLDAITEKMMPQLTTYGRVMVSHYLPTKADLKWWEKVLLWNPCNDFVDLSVRCYVIPEHDLIIVPAGVQL